MAPRQRTVSSDDDESLTISTKRQQPEQHQQSAQHVENSKSPSTQKLSFEQKTVSSLARERHDVFNMIALIPLILLTIICIDWDLLLFQGESLETAWKDDHFMEYWISTSAYFVIDLIWVIRVPTCVKSPGTIVKHHSIVLFILLGPLLFPQYRWFMGANLSVEVNTWFLIARRIAYKRNFPGFVCQLIGVLFYTSWIAIRCCVYPMVLFHMLILLDEGVRETGTWMHFQIIFIPVHFALCILNLKWTYNLFSPIVYNWWKRNGEKVGVSNGL